MKTSSWLALTGLIVVVGVPITSLAQSFDINQLLLDLRIAEKEEAAAKEIRLKWISEERTRIREELREYESELTELRSIVPDPVKPRVVPPAVAKAKERELGSFNGWASDNNPQRTVAVVRGAGLNALLRVLGPVAHYRKERPASQAGNDLFPSLRRPVTQAVSVHFRMVPATSTGSRVGVRLNQSPLELEWPPILKQHWSSDCLRIQKIRDEYVEKLRTTGTAQSQLHVEQANLLDSALRLLQAKVVKHKRTVPRDLNSDSQRRMLAHQELQDAIRYLETVVATTYRFKLAPSDYKIHRFADGSIEEFLDFCYTHGMVFQAARPADEEHYLAVYRLMQDYAHDLQVVEDWKDDLKQRISELGDEDQQLVWRASDQ